MLSPLLRRKITLLFLVFDVDENGYIERDDFLKIAKDLGAIRNLEPDSVQFATLRTAFTDLYDNLSKLMDRNADARVELDEWITYFEKMMATDEMYKDTSNKLSASIFGLLDDNRDEQISLAEYKLFADVYRIDDVNDVFNKLDANGDGVITADEFHQMVDQFFTSDDPDAPGNYSFGAY